MKAMGISDSYMDAEEGYVYGTVPGDPTKPVIGLIAHMDTAPDASGANIQANRALRGRDIVLNEAEHIVMKEADFPSLTQNRGKHLIVTDGTTLLGGRRQGRDCGNPHRSRTPPGPGAPMPLCASALPR